MSNSRWFRVNCDWWESEWVNALEPEACLSWILLLGRVKTHGLGGRLKIASTALLARQWPVGEKGIKQMLKAAEDNGALIVDGDSWIIAGWSKYQGDESNADRQKRFREQKRLENEGQTEAKKPPERPPANLKRNESNALRNGVTHTKTKTKTNNSSPNPSSGGLPDRGDGGGGFDLQAGIDGLFERHCEALLDERRKRCNSNAAKARIKACLMANGMLTPREHFERVKASHDQLLERVARGFDRQFVPGFDKFFDPMDDECKGWRGDWRPEPGEPQISGTGVQPKLVGLYDPDGAQFFVDEAEVEGLIAEGWTRTRPRKREPSDGAKAMAAEVLGGK